MLQADTRRRRLLARPSRLRAAAAVVALALLGAACANDVDTSPTGPSSSFRRVQGASFQFEKPSASVRDLVPPSGEMAVWTVVGSIFDPASGTSTAATWESDDGRSWERHEVDPASGDVSEAFAAAAVTDAGRLAVGWVGDGAKSDAAVWREEDGEWVRRPDPVFESEHQQWAFDLATGDSGMVVAGSESVWGEVRTRLWFSPDGETWESVDGGPEGPFASTGPSSVDAVAAIGDGFVAVGSRTGENDQDGAAWYSADGRTWEALETPTLGGPGRQALRTVAHDGDVVVAGGFMVDGNGQGQPVVWRSQNGRDWGDPSAPLSLYDDDRSNAADLSVRSLSVDKGGITAVGGSDWRPHLWRSTDAGVSWSALPNPVGGGLFKDGVALEGGATRKGVTVAVGNAPQTVMRLEGERWVDATGDAFPKGGVQPFATSLAVGKKATLAAGGRFTPAANGDRERYVGHVWRRGPDGWSAVKTDKLGDGRIWDITQFANGFVAVGLEDFGRAAQRTAGDPSPNGLIWTSPDGKKWKRIAADPVNIPEELLPLLAENENATDEIAGAITSLEFEQPLMSKAPAGGAGTRSLQAVAPLGKGFIAVGFAFDESGAEPLVVVSDDGKGIRGENADFGGEGTRRFADVCGSPDGEAVAVGTSGNDGSIDLAVRHRDPKGTWSRGAPQDKSFKGPGDQRVAGCAASEDGFIIVGSDNGAGDTNARIWTSDDGVTWTRLTSGTLGGPGDQEATAVTAVPGGGWLVGGTDTATGTSDVALWRVDADGEITRRDQTEPALGGPGDQSVSSLVADENRVLVVGEDFGRVGVWESDSLDR